MQVENKDGDRVISTPARRRRPWLWVAIAVVLGLVVFVAVLPQLAAIGPIRDLLLRAVLPKINGSVHAGGARLGWFSPIHFDDITFASPDGQPVISIARLEGNRALAAMLFRRSDLGEFRIEQPQAHVVLDREGSNIRRLLVEHRKPPNMALGVRVSDASVSVRAGDSARPWKIEPINVRFQLVPSWTSADGRPRLAIAPGVLVPRAEITSETCHDLLKYIAPVLAEATDASGSFSIELDRWEFPVADAAEGTGSGRLTIHALELGPGPLVRELATALRVPPNLVTVANEPIAFRMADGRIYHSRLTFHVGRLVIRSEGSAGLDGSLAMVAEVPMPEPASGDLGDRPLRAALAKQTLRIPIGGTLKRPKIDGKALVASLRQSGLEVLGDVWHDKEIDLGEVLKAIRQRREERLKNRDNTPNPSDTQPKRPLLRELIRGTLDEATKGRGQQAAGSEQ
jgi:hypothetical protein